MIIKSADDKGDLETLQDLLSRTQDAAKRRAIVSEMRNIRSGMQGEAEAAYEMKVHFGSSPNWMIIHDLRIEHDGLIAQIDHLLINRFLDFWVCESKRFVQGVSINEHGEFASYYDGAYHGVGSPIEQNARHLKILKRALDTGAVALPTRLGIKLKLEFRSVILVSKNAIIERPATKLPAPHTIIKNDQLFSLIDRSIDNISPFALTKIVSTATLERMAQQLAALHRPSEFNWAAKFGLAKRGIDQLPTNGAPAISTNTNALPDQKREIKAAENPRCSNCSRLISPAVADFCRNYARRFNGMLYCIPCQRAASAVCN